MKGVCEHCGSLMYGRKRRYCNAKCRNAHRPTIAQKCLHCACDFASTKVRKCCSLSCSQSMVQSRKRILRTCRHCSKTFLRKNAGGTKGYFCSRQCSYAFKTAEAVAAREQRKSDKLSDRLMRTRACEVCSAAFVSRGGTVCSGHCRYVRDKKPRRCSICGGQPVGHRRLYCESCRQSKHSEQKRTYRKVRKSRHRARMRGVQCEPVKPTAVFERDAYRCGICGKKCIRHKAVPHPKAPTIDHIVALANGGSHTMDNLQCAHFRCNALKQDRGGGQRRLFG